MCPVWLSRFLIAQNSGVSKPILPPTSKQTVNIQEISQSTGKLTMSVQVCPCRWSIYISSNFLWSSYPDLPCICHLVQYGCSPSNSNDTDLWTDPIPTPFMRKFKKESVSIPADSPLECEPKMLSELFHKTLWLNFPQIEEARVQWKYSLFMLHIG